MATTQEEIKEWLEEAKRNGSTHMLVVCDTYDYEDYPVYVKKGQNCQDVVSAYHGKDMQRVMEVYSMSKDLKEQLNVHRSWNID